MKITDKDWIRMSDLVLSGKDGASVAKSIKDKTKAILRFVAGLKLENGIIQFNERWNQFSGSFSEFGNRALELGATVEEIKDTYCENSVPKAYSDKLARLSTKKFRDRFVGSLSKAIIDAGLDINFLPCNGWAITMEGKEAMARNGRKWTIGYKTEITNGDKTVRLVFDAITDEGDGPTSYVIATNDSDTIFRGFNHWERLGKQNFILSVMESLK